MKYFPSFGKVIEYIYERFSPILVLNMQENKLSPKYLLQGERERDR